MTAMFRTGRGAVPVVAVLLLAVSGCGGGGEEPPSRTGDVPDAALCDVLTPDAVKQQTGQDTTLEARTVSGATVCAYGTDDGAPAVLVRLLPPDQSLDDLVTDSRAGSADEATTEEVEVAGADEAVLLRDTSYGSTTVSAIARTSAAGYVVYGVGDTEAEEERIAVALLTILLGGEVEDGYVDPPHPCDVLSAREVSQEVGEPVTVERDQLSGPDTPHCAYAPRDRADDTDVSLLGFGITDSVDYLVEADADRGLTAEEFSATGFEEAFLVKDPSLGSRVRVYLNGSDGAFLLGVDTDSDSGSEALAAALLPGIAR